MFKTHILIPGYLAYCLASSYGEFAESLTWFGMYCSIRPRRRKGDYVRELNNLKEDFKRLLEETTVSNWAARPVEELFAKIEVILKAPRISDSNLDKIRDLVLDFAVHQLSGNRLGTFGAHFLEEAIESAAEDFYPNDLYESVATLTGLDEHDAAIQAAFKFLDAHLQKLLGLSPYQSYGEELINSAFSPKSGALQLGTCQREQEGLRNWVSGANAFFRNPVAHRFTNLGSEAVLAIIAMVALMANIATDLAEKRRNQRPDESSPVTS